MQCSTDVHMIEVTMKRPMSIENYTHCYHLHFEQCYDFVCTDEGQHFRLYLTFNVQAPQRQNTHWPYVHISHHLQTPTTAYRDDVPGLK